MYLVQCEHRGFKQVECLIKSQGTVLLGVMRKVLALEVFHDDIRRAVFLKIVPEGDNIAVLDELGKSLGLFQETSLAYFEDAVLFIHRRKHCQSRAAVGDAAGIYSFIATLTSRRRS